MQILQIQPIVALIAGVLILLMPRLLNYIVALYLIFIGITGLVAPTADRPRDDTGRRAMPPPVRSAGDG